MYNNRAILKRVGIVLIAMGILDIAYMIYCLLHDQSYSASFNIPSVVAGVFLLRGSLRAVPIITGFAAFMISAFVSTIFILLPFFKPAELWATELRLDPVGLSLSLLVKFTTIAILWWVYTQLRSVSVVSRAKSDDFASSLKLTFIVGIAWVVILAGIMHFTFNSASGAKAVEMARAKYGENYQYHITSMRWSNGYVSASLTAYNEQEIKQVQVKWKQ